MTTTQNTAGILVGVDGSEYSDAALRWAAREAALHHEPLTVITIAERPALKSHDIDLMQRLETAQRDACNQILADAQQVLDEALGDQTPSGQTPSKVHTEFRFAHPLSHLIDASKVMRMVVVGCRGKGALDRLTLGSVSSGLVRHAHGPVAVIHKERAEPEVWAPVLLGIDGSPASEFATAIAFDEASHRHAPLIAMHSWSESLTAGAHLNWAADEERGHEVLSERLAGWREKYPDVHVTPKAVHQDAARWLVNHSDKAQLVVVGSHGRGGFAGMLLGSVSATVVYAAEVPVIVARTS